MLQFAAQVKQIQSKNPKKIESSMPRLSHQVNTLHSPIVHKLWIRRKFLLKGVLEHGARQEKKPLGKSKTA